MSTVTYCDRCASKSNISTNAVLQQGGKRHDLCRNCYADALHWIKNVAELKPLGSPAALLLTKNDVATRMSVSKRTVDRMIANRQLKPVRVNNGSVRFTEQSILDYISGRIEDE